MRRIASTTLLLLLAFLTTGCAPVDYTNLSNEEFQGLVEQGVTVVDIRRPEEWRETGVIKGSHPITLFDANGRLQESFFSKLTEIAPDKTAPIVLICRTGSRTQAGSQMLVEHLGYSDVYNVTRGITSWIRDGRSVGRI